MGQSISTLSTIIPSVPGRADAGFFQSISFLLPTLQWELSERRSGPAHLVPFGGFGPQGHLGAG